MGLNKFVNITTAEIKNKGVVSLANNPNKTSAYGRGGLTPTELKLWFDQLGTFLAGKINAIQNALGGTDAASYIKLILTGLDIEAEQQAGFEYSIQDLCDSFLDGNFADYVKVYESASASELATLQSVLNKIAQRLSNIDASLLTKMQKLTSTEMTTAISSGKVNNVSLSNGDLFVCKTAGTYKRGRIYAFNIVTSGSTTTRSWVDLTDSNFQELVSSHIQSVVNNSHSHSNKALIDSYTQTNANLADAVNKKHSHSNKTILDNITSAFTTAQASKLTDLDSAITGITLNATTGVMTFKRYDNSTFEVDTLLEKVVTNFQYNSTTKNLELTLKDGTVQTVPMAAFIDDYSGSNGSEITVGVSSSNVITATLVSGSIAKSKLASAVQNEITANTNNRHSHSNKTLLDSYTQTETNLADAVSKKHSHSNSSVLNSTTASFTTELKNKIDTNTSNIATLTGLVQAGGTVVYQDGVALQSFNLEDIIYAAFAYQAENASYARNCTKGGEIDRRLKALGG